jgi:hypothetical protein
MVVGMARKLVALSVALVATACCAAPASALDVKVRVELNTGDAFHSFVERQLTSVAAGGPAVVDPSAATVPPAIPSPGCRSDSAIAALQHVVGAANLRFTTTPNAADPAAAPTVVIDRLKAQPTAAGAPLSWVVYVHGTRATNPCASMSPDDAGTEVLAYMQCSATTSAPCFKGVPLILRTFTDAPWQVTPATVGVGVNVLAYRVDAGGTFPSTSAFVRGDEGQSVPTDPVKKDGSAFLRFAQSGPHTVAVTDVFPTGTINVPDHAPICVTTNTDGFCGTVAITPPPFDDNNFPSPCATNGHDGLCGTPDTSGPLTRVTSVTNKQIFKKKKGPKGLKGTIEPDPNAVKDVQLRLTRATTSRVLIKAKKPKKGSRKKAKKRYKTVKRCTYWDDTTALIEKAKTCGTKGGRWFEASRDDLNQNFDYDFALTLPAGSYTLEVLSHDLNGSPDLVEPGRNVITFTVKKT